MTPTMETVSEDSTGLQKTWVAHIPHMSEHLLRHGKSTWKNKACTLSI